MYYVHSYVKNIYPYKPVYQCWKKFTSIEKEPIITQTGNLKHDYINIYGKIKTQTNKCGRGVNLLNSS